MMEYDFYERLNMSMESCQLESDAATLSYYFRDAESVEKTDVETDKSGIDYIVTLDSGVKIGVDVKARSKFKYKTIDADNPPLALEMWSQKWENGERKNIPGWTWDKKKKCDYVMYKFDKTDCGKVFIFPFQQLRKAFWTHGKEWTKQYISSVQCQKNAGYVSECVFVPANVVINAVKGEFVAELIS